jgi:CxxC motif-containing protein
VQYLRRIEVKAPVRTGEIIVENILGTEADIIATKNLEAL